MAVLFSLIRPFFFTIDQVRLLTSLASPACFIVKKLGIWHGGKICKTLLMSGFGGACRPLKANILIESVRYRGSGHTIYINTATLSPAAAKVTRFVETTKLADGTPASIAIAEDIKTPNLLVFVKGKVYVTIASDLPIEQIKSLATSVVLK